MIKRQEIMIKVMQAAGLVIIIISIAAVATFAQIATTSANINQPARTEVQPTNIASQESSNHVVTIPLGAGTEGELFEYYSPASLQIRNGDTVTWTNRDTVGHTVTSVAFSSDQIWPHSPDSKGNFTYSHTFDRNGVYTYFCQIHPYMSGTIYVGTQETQRELTSTNSNLENIAIEMPAGSAYRYKFEQGFFIPANTYLSAGSRVTWVNHDYVAHTATATDGSFDTSVVDPRESKTLIISEPPGRIAYYCRIHPWMQASLTVTK